MSSINHYKLYDVKGAAAQLSKKTGKTHVVISHKNSARYEICTADKYRELKEKSSDLILHK